MGTSNRPLLPAMQQPSRVSESFILWMYLHQKHLEAFIVEARSHGFRFLGLHDTTHSIVNFAGTIHHVFLVRLAWQLVIYETWRERNNRLHRGSFRAPDLVLSLITRTIKNIISSFRQENPEDSSNCMQLWLSMS